MKMAPQLDGIRQGEEVGLGVGGRAVRVVGRAATEERECVEVCGEGSLRVGHSQLGASFADGFGFTD